MSAPVLHVLAGPNGSGKSTFAHEVLQPITHLPFVNADEIAAQRWPGEEEQHAYDAAAAAAEARARALRSGASFIAETVFSHPSKVELVQQAVALGYLVELHVMLVPEDLAVARVAYRVEGGGHTVPEEKVRERYRRLWRLIAEATRVAHRAHFYDNSRADAFRRVAGFELGRPAGTPTWPAWTPRPLIARL
ncbi:MAG TPA: AAA family ATPase [Solirubrobacteraceae bacterium]|nr:AAA family ATPase [Solirubrobacteraceae bacterium]